MPTPLSDRIVITGVGTYNPAGNSVAESWKSITAGESFVDLFDSPLSQSWPGRYFAAGRPVGQFGTQQLAYNEANQQAGLVPAFSSTADREETDRQRAAREHNRIGFAFGASKGRLDARAPTSPQANKPDEHEPTRLLIADHPLYTWPPSSIGNDLHRVVPVSGPATCPVAACASGLVALIQAARWIEWGSCDAVIAGSADFSLTQSVIAAYRRLGVLSNWSGPPTAACRPFDRDRSGFVIGEGAGVFILESESHANARQAEPLAVWSGHDHRTDPTGFIESDPTGQTIRVVAENAIRAACLTTNDISAVCCHGTGTVANDRAEAVALRRLFRRRLDDVPCFSLKGAIGHTLGASGAIETALCVQALRTQTLPPHLHADHRDPSCPIGPLLNVATPTTINHILKLSYGFGGHVAAAILSTP